MTSPKLFAIFLGVGGDVLSRSLGIPPVTCLTPMENFRDPHVCPLDFYHMAGNNKCFTLRSSYSDFGLVSASLPFLFSGQGPSKKAAKHKAAEVALRLLKGGNMLEPAPLDEAR